MATISTLAVNLIARTSSFQKGMKKGKTSVKGLKSSITGAIGTVARFAKRLALIAGVGAIGFFIKSTLSSLDAVSKLSRRIGMATEELLGLRHAAELAGVSNQALDKSLEIFVRRMGEVKSGSGEATRGLEALGLSAESMINMTPEKSLLVIANRIQELGTQSEKSAAAYFLFGRSGAQLLNLFEQGAAGITKATDEAKKLGLTLEGFDLTKVEEANDAMTKFKSTIKATFMQAVIRLTPALKKIANFMTKYKDGIIGAIKKTVIFAAKSFLMVKAIQFVVGAIRLIVSAYKVLAARQITFLSLSGPAGWATLAVGIGIATVAIIGLNAAIDDTIRGINNVSAAGEKVSDTGLVPRTIGGVEAKISQLENTISMLVGTTDEFLQGTPILGGSIAGARAFGLKDAEVALATYKSILSQMKMTKRVEEERAEIEKERVARLQLEKISLTSIEKFIEGVTNQIDSVGLSSLEAQLLSLSKLGDKLGGDAWIKFNENIGVAQDLVDELLEKQNALKEKPGDLPSSKFQQIRSAFIDVAALNPSANPTTELARLNKKTDISNRFLGEINKNLMGVHSA